jgi:hypothetical protein
MKTKDGFEISVSKLTLQDTYDDIAVGMFQDALYATTNKVFRFYMEFKNRRRFGRKENWPSYWPKIYLALPGCPVIDLHQYDDWENRAIIATHSSRLKEDLTWEGDLPWKVCAIEFYSKHIFEDKEDADGYGSWGLVLTFVDSFDKAKEQITSLVENFTWEEMACNVFV